MMQELSYLRSHGPSIYLEPLKGTSIDDCAWEAAVVAYELLIPVFFVFNDVPLTVWDGDDPECIVKIYYEKLKEIQGARAAQ